MDEDSELGFMLERRINTLAALLYQSQNRIFDPKIDFKNSRHPEERGCWNKAIIAHSFINDDSELLEHQVK